MGNKLDEFLKKVDVIVTPTSKPGSTDSPGKEKMARRGAVRKSTVNATIGFGKADAVMKPAGGVKTSLSSKKDDTGLTLQAKLKPLQKQGIVETAPHILGVFDWNPLYTSDINGLPEAFIDQAKIFKEETEQPLIATVTAELMDLQVQSKALKYDAFATALTQYINSRENTGGGGSSVSPSTMSETILADSEIFASANSTFVGKMETAKQVIAFYNIMYRAINATYMAIDLKGYTLSNPKVETIGPAETWRGPNAWTSSDIWNVTSCPGAPPLSSVLSLDTTPTLKEYFVNHWKYSEDWWSSAKNTKIFHTLIKNLYFALKYCTPNLLAVNSDENAYVGSSESYTVPDAGTSSSVVRMIKLINTISKLKTNVGLGAGMPGEAPEGVLITDMVSDEGGLDYSAYTVDNYVSTISKLPDNSSKRIAACCHIINRDIQFAVSNPVDNGSNAASIQTDPSIRAVSDLFTIGGEGPDPAMGGSGDSETMAEIKDMLGLPFGSILNSDSKVGVSSLGFITDETQLYPSRAGSSTVLPFETRDINFIESGDATADYSSGLDFFIKRLTDSSDNATQITSDSITARLRVYSEAYNKAIDSASENILGRMHGLSNPGLAHGYTSNNQFYDLVLEFLQLFFYETDHGKSMSLFDAGQLAFLELANDPKIGHALMKVMMCISEQEAATVSGLYSYPGWALETGAPSSTGPVGLSAITDDMSTMRQEAFVIGDEELSSAMSSEDEINRSLWDTISYAAKTLHNYCSELSPTTSAPRMSDPDVPDSSPMTFVLTTFLNSDDGTLEGHTGWTQIIYEAITNSDSFLRKFHATILRYGYLAELYNSNSPTDDYGRSLRGSGLDTNHQQRVAIGTIMLQTLISRCISTRVASTGFRQYTYATADEAGGPVTFDAPLGLDYQDIRIDLYESQLLALEQAAGSLTGYYPPPDGTVAQTETRRVLSQVCSHLSYEDVEISNILFVLRSIGKRLHSAAEKLQTAADDIFATESTDAERNVTSITTALQFSNDYPALARSIIEALITDVHKNTLQYLTPEQIKQMSATNYGLYNYSQYYNTVASSKIISPSECKILQSVSTLGPMIASSGKRKRNKIFSIGIPAGLIHEMRKASIVNYDAIVDEDRVDFMPGLVKVTIYKRDLQRDFKGFTPKSFYFDPSLYILPRHQMATELPALTSNPIDILDNTIFHHFNLDANGGTLNYDRNSDGRSFSAFASEVYPTMDTQVAYHLGLSHAVSRNLNLYLKLVKGINLDEGGFQIGPKTGFGGPDPLNRNLYNSFLNFILNYRAITNTDRALFINYLKTASDNASIFNGENYLERSINCSMFDRVFNVLVDIDSFSEPPPEFIKGVPGAVGGGGTKVSMSRVESCEPATYEDYFASVEFIPYDPESESNDLAGMLDLLDDIEDDIIDGVSDTGSTTGEDSDVGYYDSDDISDFEEEADSGHTGGGGTTSGSGDDTGGGGRSSTDPGPSGTQEDDFDFTEEEEEKPSTGGGGTRSSPDDERTMPDPGPSHQDTHPDERSTAGDSYIGPSM